ncbi:MAG: hypothetical protein J6336_05275 [Kiritimatiellae bacterium]|nr:hypothetical protein [Kiritimatiellia bacterium]
MKSGFRIITLFLGWIGAVSAVFAESAPSVDPLSACYQRCRPLLLGSNTVVEQEGHLLIATAVRSNDEDFARDVLKARCEEQVAGWMLKDRHAPETVNTNVARILTTQFLRVTGFIESLDGWVCLDSRRIPDGFACIWGIPAEAFHRQTPDWNALTAALLNPARLSHPDYPPLSVWEIAPPEWKKRLKEVAINRAQSRYGYAYSRLLADGVLADYAPALALSLTQDLLSRATPNQLHLLLARLPGDPRILAEIASRYRRLGLVRASDWIASFGTLSFIDYAASQTCEQLVTKPDGTAIPMASYPYPFELAPFRKAFETADFSETPLEIFNRWRQPFPGGNGRQPDTRDRAFAEGMARIQADPPDFETAYAAFLRSAGAHLTFAACHQAGLCAKRLDRPYEAIFLLAQAAVIKPYHRDTWTRLEELCRLIGDAAAREACVPHLTEEGHPHESE